MGEALVLLAQPGQGGVRGGGEGDDGGAPVDRVRAAGRPAVGFERVDQAGDRPRRYPESLAERPHEHRPGLVQRPEHPAPGEAEAVLACPEVLQVHQSRGEPEQLPYHADRQVSVVGIGAA